PTGAGSYMGHPQAGYVHTDIDANLPNNDFAYGLRYSASGNVSGLPNLLGIQIDYQIIDPERTVTTGSVLTDASGNYLIENIKVGSLVTVYPLPNETVTTLTGPVLYAATPLTGYYDELADTDITNLDFIYVPTYTASGTVKGLPDDAGVQIDYVIYGPITGDQRPGTVYTDSNGYYEIPGIPERGRITITAPVRLFEPGEGFYDSDDSGGYDLRNVGDNMPGNDFNYFTEDPGGETPPPNPRPPVTPVTPTPPAPTPRVPVPAPAPAPQPGTRMPRTGDFVNIFGLLLLGLLAAAALGKLGYDQYKTRGVRKD
ncbi:MAG: hypothetical protein FWE46_06510, partial [Coriobacteriia bacterium]|nr:hypothetical protein [Coriobacteriia bacterium]